MMLERILKVKKQRIIFVIERQMPLQKTSAKANNPTIKKFEKITTNENKRNVFEEYFSTRMQDIIRYRIMLIKTKYKFENIKNILRTTEKTPMRLTQKVFK